MAFDISKWAFPCEDQTPVSTYICLGNHLNCLLCFWQ